MKLLQCKNLKMGLWNNGTRLKGNKATMEQQSNGTVRM